MSDINLNLNLLTKRYEASTKRVTNVTKAMSKDVLRSAANIKTGLVQFQAPLIAAEKSAFSLRKRFSEFKPVVDSANSSFSKLSKAVFAGLSVFSLAQGAISGIKGAISTTARNYLELENAQIAVAKTTTLSSKQVEQLTQRFKVLSGQIPTSTNELLRLGSVAGQLGVDGVEDIALFAETISKLNSATDLVGEEGARSLARILNITGESAQSVDNLGSAIVGLGNNFAATESEIVRVATEVSKSTSQFNIGSANVVGLSTALKALGQQAQLGGSVVGKTFREINNAVQNGGSTLDKFAQIAGVSGETFANTFSADKTRGFQLFIEGLGRLDSDQLSITLDELGLKGDEVNKVLPVLAQRSELVGQALAQANKDFRENIALNEEASRAYSSTSSQLDILGNNFSNIGTSIVSSFAPAFKSSIVLMNDFFNLVNDTQGLQKLQQELNSVEQEILALNQASATQGKFSFAAADTSALEAQRDALKENIAEFQKFEDIVTNPYSIDSTLNQELKQLESQLKLTELGFNTTFGENSPLINGTADQLREKIQQIKNELAGVDGNEDSASGTSSNVQQDTRNKETIQKEKELQIEITKIQAEARIAREQAEIEARQLRGEASAADLDRLRELEQQKLAIFFEAENQKAQLIQEQTTRDLELEKLKNERIVEEEKLKNDALKEEAKSYADFQEKQRKFEQVAYEQNLKKQEDLDRKAFNEKVRQKKIESGEILSDEEKLFRNRLGAAAQLSGSLSLLAKKDSKEGKALAIAQATINTYLGASKALSQGGPFIGPVLAASMIAQGLAQVSAIKSAGNFETGGIISGASNTGDRLTANVNSGEMILNRRQQTELFNQANGQSSSGGMSAEMISTIVRETVSNMNVTLVANDNEIARSASRGAINGVVIGVSE